ncbi:hypothetical protein BSE24067_07034 [Burkholderia seminalis]|nr:hypothetical protein BSE24067_07034 [Burkholderia seminalis]
MPGLKNPRRRSRRRRAFTTRCVRSKPAPRNGPHSAAHSRPMRRTPRRPPQPRLEWLRQQAASPRRQRRPCRTHSFRQRTVSRPVTLVLGSSTMPRPHATTARRSYWMRSCRRSPASPRRLPIGPPRRSTAPHRTRCRMLTRAPAATMPCRRIKPTMTSVTSTLRPPHTHLHLHLHMGSRRRRRSTPRSISRRGRTSAARRFPRSKHRPRIRSLNHRQTQRNRSRPTPPSRNKLTKQRSTKPPHAIRQHSPIPPPRRSNALHRLTCHRVSMAHMTT